MAKLIVCLAVCMLLGSAISEMTAEEAQFFGAAVTSASQLVVEQEMQRKFADIFIGFQQASSFRTMAMAKLESSRVHASVHGSESPYAAFLELKSQAEPSQKDLEMFPFMFGGFGGYGAGYGAQQQQQPSHFSDPMQAEKAETQAKITALKYLFLQVLTTASDVQQQYWINKVISAAVPQIATIKLYKSYLSTFALSSAIQLHDVYTFEAYIDDFNDNFYEQAGESARLTESIAEISLFRSWQSLVYMRFFLFYIGMYEKSIAAQTPVAQPPIATAPSFLEEESTAEPTKQDASSMMSMQYMYMSYYVYILKYYALFTEMSIPQYGSMMAQTKYQAQVLLTDEDTGNDEQGHKLKAQADQLDGHAVPMAIAQWSSIVFMRYYFEYFLMMFDMYNPAMSQARQFQRIDDALLNLNLAQVEKH